MRLHLFTCFLLFFNLSLFAQRELTNELIWYSNIFAQNSIDEVRSMKNGEQFTSLDLNEEGFTEINKYNYKDYKKTATVVSSKNILDGNEPVMIQEYEFNADETKLLIATDIEFIYRRSYMAYYYIYDLKTKTTLPLAPKIAGKQMLAEFSPDGKKVAFVRNNNIYVFDIATKTETAVTSDGEKNKIINGATDWVYEEEFSIVKAFYWSPASTKIAYLKFNETHVKEFTMPIYGSLYPELYTFKYPKAGEDNSMLTLWIYDVSAKTHTQADIYDNTHDIYIPRMKWGKKDNRLFIQRMNRLQNKLEYCSLNTDSLNQKIKPFYTETSKTYVEINDDWVFLDKQEAFIRTSETDGYNHIYIVDFKGNAKQITKGNFDVVEFKGIDENNNLIYYIAAEEGAHRKDLYVIKTDGTGKKKLSTQKSGVNNAEFSTGMKYYINYWTDANTPLYITLHQANGKQLKVLEDNKELNNTLKQFHLSPKEFFKFNTSENIELNAWMIKPKKFDTNKKYPVLLFVYGGPGNNEVVDSWEGPQYMWHQMLAQKGYLIVCVDPRGTMFRGEEFKKCTYLQLGKLETQDCIETAKYLSALPYIDKNRIGVQGWSYGGYMTLLCMTKGADYFKTGISVAPVTNWRYYDNIYTERFMRTPQENARGYDENSPINHADKLKGKLLLIHGSADDNVHYQNSMEIINAFIKSNKQFDMFIYPNRNHGIYGGNTRLHLYTQMTNYILKNL
jgi:dipeptidyl-peptidase-4